MKHLMAIALVAGACGGKSQETQTVPTSAGDTAASPGPDAWADWKSFTNVSPGPWISKTHGSRFVEIYVNEVGLAAYKSEGEAMPVGSIVVKPSWENTDGAPGADGPLFVMQKMPAGFAPESEDWLYAFQWENPPAKWAAKIGTNVDWRTPSEKAEYCADCHDGIERGLGMPPTERRSQW